jgi:hypothetical protein
MGNQIDKPISDDKSEHVTAEIFTFQTPLNTQFPVFDKVTYVCTLKGIFLGKQRVKKILLKRLFFSNTRNDRAH